LTYQYTNDQEASLHWYHDHGEGVTRINAYAGLAGLYVVRDANEAALIKANLMPTGPYEMPIVIQDKVFAADGSIAYTGDVPALNGWNATTVPETPISVLPGFDYNPADPATAGPGTEATHVPEMFGDVICVNGVAWPTLIAEPRQYRLRLLNGSDSRVYNLNFGGLQFMQISTDLGLLNIPVQMSTIKLFPGERKDIVIDFADRNGATLIVTNDAATPYPTGTPPSLGTDTIFQIKISKRLDVSKYKETKLTDLTILRGRDKLTPLLPIVVAAPAGLTRRQILLGEGCDEYGRVMPLLGTVAEGTKQFHDAPDITPQVGTTEIWEFWNTTVDAHPIHLHLVQMRVIDRQQFSGTVVAKPMANGWTGVKFAAAPVLSRRSASPAPMHEQGWKDTVECPPGYVTRVLVSFDKPGKYVYHCHILGHEEHDMMRWYQVI
jgi:spore coat protein A